MSQNGTNDSRDFELAPSKPPKRRLVVMFDGTGNTRPSLTNVARMFEAIDDSDPESDKRVGSGSEDSKAHEGPAPTRVEPELQPVQLVKYIAGVGTNCRRLTAWATGLTFGYGLSDKIKEGYTWLCENYESEEDHVFVFGFSRGAFAARSLVSLLHKCDGVLKKKNKSGEGEFEKIRKTCVHLRAIENAYSHYQNCLKSTDVNHENDLKKDFISTDLAKHEDAIIRLKVQVKMLGVWDTVGALGIPHTHVPIIDNSILGRKHYEFHGQDLSCIVDNAYHALALDECRKDFEPTLWLSRTSKKQEVKQVWFVGSHCNVGGGADLHDNDDPDDLWQYSYVWMQRHAEKHGLRFYWRYESPATRQINSHLPTRRVSLREPEPSYKNFVRGLYSNHVEPFNRRANPTLAMLHWSVVERLKVTRQDMEAQTEDLGEKKLKPYRPESLLGDYCSHDFLETVIPEDSTVVTAPDQVDVKGTPKMAAPKWHIETDDVWKKPQWTLPLYQEGKKEEEKEEGKEKEAKKVE